ncbi:MAG: polyprenyl synthetase family protein, partial [Propionibacterium sp.]|nr:polyprenyl synthetase family protein [Propionibacterium sp.]
MDPAFESRVRALLDTIEERLLQAARADTDLVTGAAQHIIAAGGKRFRPMLVVLSALLGTPRDDDDLARAALVMELTHVASLYHDDVMDEAEIRRGADSANSRWDNTVAILVGDFLFARASDQVAELGPDFVRVQARTFARLVQG